MKTFFTSDTHFYHSNIIKYCNRPFADAQDMNETLIANWNNVVDYVKSKSNQPFSATIKTIEQKYTVPTALKKELGTYVK